MARVIKIVALSGSLRKCSFHTGLIRYGNLLLIQIHYSLLPFLFLNNFLLSSSKCILDDMIMQEHLIFSRWWLNPLLYLGIG